MDNDKAALTLNDERMRRIPIHHLGWAITMLGFSPDAFADISFQLGTNYLEAIYINEDIEYISTTNRDDAGLTLVFKDAYLADTRVNKASPLLDPQFSLNTRATINGSISSDHSHFRTFTTGPDTPDLPANYDVNSTDLLLFFSFSSYDVFNLPWSLSVGDTITIKSGSIFAISEYDIPNPDNLTSQITTQIYSSNFPVAFTEEKILAVVPEVRMIPFIFGAVVLIFTLHKRRNRSG
ncbi:hypothetical protein SH580_04000 [Coraliomargarita algicola]|uniref:Uncharacterized protein n=1 Tax=Coraliomargarita algicola TaxID=3092156 RepID=A0ABZ0RP14_9BACT|nr:hypothetical protein [Coraliomargarita sp. J2-16]WPJ96868.1 hypothetical protein SH580_04000 [Coraliomargarita sp. J2-16]